MADVTPEQQAARLFDFMKGFNAVHLVATGVEPAGRFADVPI